MRSEAHLCNSMAIRVLILFKKYKLLIAACQVENINSIAKNLIIKNFQRNGKKCQGFSYKSSGSPINTISDDTQCNGRRMHTPTIACI